MDDGTGVAAYCGADGQLSVLSPVALPKSGRHTGRVAVVASLQAANDDAAQGAAQPPHAAMATAAAPALRLGPAKPARAVSIDTVGEVQAAMRVHCSQALHRCRWSAQLQGASGDDGPQRLLAAAGAAGVLRILRLRLQQDGAAGDGKSSSDEEGDDSD